MIQTDDDGGITLIVLTLCVALLSFTSLIGFGINGLITSNRLNNTADRVALGAATQLVSNPENTCILAKELATTNEVELLECLVKDDEVTIRVGSKSEIQQWLSKWQKIGWARAGVDYIYD